MPKVGELYDLNDIDYVATTENTWVTHRECWPPFAVQCYWQNYLTSFVPLCAYPYGTHEHYATPTSALYYLMCKCNIFPHPDTPRDKIMDLIQAYEMDFEAGVRSWGCKDLLDYMFKAGIEIYHLSL